MARACRARQIETHSHTGAGEKETSARRRSTYDRAREPDGLLEQDRRVRGVRAGEPGRAPRRRVELAAWRHSTVTCEWLMCPILMRHIISTYNCTYLAERKHLTVTF